MRSLKSVLGVFRECREFKGSIRFYTLLIGIFFSCFCFLSPIEVSAYEIDEIEETIQIDFPLDFAREREKTLDIPGIRSVKDILVDNGVVEYEITGSILKIKVKDGAIVDEVPDVKTVSETIKAFTQDELPNNIQYNKDGYVGTLNKKGSPYQVVLSGSPAHSMTVTKQVTWTENIYYVSGAVYDAYGNRSWGWYYSHKTSGSEPGSAVSYNQNGYTGTLYSVQGSSKSHVSRHVYSLPTPTGPGQQALAIVDTFARLYSGTVSKPDTRVYGYAQDYEGQVTGPNIPRYSYKVTATIVKAKVKSMTYKFPRGSSRNRETTLNIPKLSAIINVTVDTGNVTYKRTDADKIQINVSNGSPVYSYTPSKYVTITDSYTSTSSSPNFSSTYYYNDGYYSGYISKDGSPWSTSREESKKVSYYWGSITRTDYYIYTGSGWVFDHSVPSVTPLTQWYSDSEGYSGYVSRVRTGTTVHTYYTLPSNPSVGQIAPYCYYTAYYNMEGTVYRTVYTHYQRYSGTVYGPTQYEYEYNVTIEYVDDAPAPPGPFINPTSNNKEKGNTNLDVQWNPTEDWGPGTATTRKYELEFYDGSNWTDVTTIQDVNPATFYEFLLPYLNTNKARFRVRAATNLGYSPWVYSDEFIVDSTPPTVTASKTSSEQKQTTGRITLTYSDNLSGVKIKQYAWNDSDEYVPLKWNDYTSAVEKTDIGTWYLWYRAVDNSGNEAIDCFGPYKVLFPEDISITAVPSYRDWDKTDVTVTVNVSITGGTDTRTNKGGGGGGATDIRRGGNSLEDRIIVAGGGGGAGGDSYGGSSSIQVGSGGKPGVGGGLTGGDGEQGTDNTAQSGYGGKGGTSSAGGQGGVSKSTSYSSNDRYYTPGNGGGGGGGYYGGGGGAGGSVGGSGFAKYGENGKNGILGKGGDGGEGAPRTYGYYSGAGGGGGGGSSYIGGVTNGKTIAGDQIMPNPLGGTMVGKSGDGYARISRYVERPAKDGDVFNFDFTGDVQTITLPPGKYKLEVWGAQGGIGATDRNNKGAYASGVLELDSEETLYIYVGGQGESTGSDSIDRNKNYYSGGFNGGGRGTGSAGPGGGGATDIRLGGTDISNRIIVAGGGGGATINATGSEGRGDVTDNINELYQGFNATARDSTPYYDIGGGGGGYYGGAGRVSDDARWSYGGTSYVDPRLTDTVIKTGKQEMPNPSGGTMTGKSGNGYARITVLDIEDNSELIYSGWEVYNFEYTGQPQSIELEPGEYFLQVWGAQGGTTGGTAGGKGGYAEGYITLDSKETLWVYVGGKGQNEKGGWNGGGNGAKLPHTIHRIEYSLSNSSTNASNWEVLEGNQITISEEGQWYLHVKAIIIDSGREHGVSAVFGPYKIDKSLPYITFDPYEHDWTNGNISVTIRGSDSLSGVKRLYYRTSSNGGQSWSTWYNTSNSSATRTFNTTGEYIIEAYALDMANNQSETYRSGIYRIDKVLPTVTFNPNGNSTWAKQHSVIVTVQDSHSGVDEDSLEYVWSTSTSTPSSGWQKFVNGESITTPEGVAGSYYLHIRAKDKAGNSVNTRSNYFRVDNVAPTAPSISLSTENWTNQDVVVTIYPGSDSHSGVDRTEYRIDGGDWQVYSSKIVLKQEGIITIEARTIDRVGNISNIVSKQAKIDKTPPPAPSIYLSNSDWTNEKVTATIEDNGDNLSGVNIIQYRINGGSWVTYTSPVSFDTQGIFTIEARVRDNAGNYSAISSAVVRIDKTKPTITANPSYRDWTNTDITVTLTYNDSGGSGLKYIKYAWSDSSITPPDSEFRDYISPVTQTESGIWYLHAKAEDNAGNVYQTYFGQYKIDKVPPTVVIEHIEAISSSSIAIFVDAEDPQPGIGLHSKPYRYYRDDNLIMDWTSYDSYIDNNLNPNTLYSYTVQARDALGNTSQPSEQVFKYTLANIPTNLTARFDGGIVVQWNPNGNPAYTKYEVEYTDGTTTNSVIVIGTSVVITDVQTDKLYRVRARAINEEGIPTNYTSYIDVAAYNVRGFKITKVRDIRWNNYFWYPITEDRLPVINEDGLTIGLGYGIDFEVETEGFGDKGDKVIIDVSFTDMSGNELDLYLINGNGDRESLESVDSENGTKYTSIILTERDRREVESSDIDGVYKWTGYYYLPFKVVAGDGELPDQIMVVFNIRAEKGTGEVVEFNKVSKVFSYVTYRTAYDDIFLDRFR